MVRIESDENSINGAFDVEIMYDHIDEIEKHFKTGKAQLSCYASSDQIEGDDEDEWDIVDIWIESKESEKGATIFMNMSINEAEILSETLVKIIEFKRKAIKDHKNRLNDNT